MPKKTYKLHCIVTGKPVIIPAANFQKKVDELGDETTVYETYICRAALNLLENQHDLRKTREILGVDIERANMELTDVILDSILKTKNIKKKIGLVEHISTSNFIQEDYDPCIDNLLTNIKNYE